MTLDDILVELKNAKTIVILTHESPDGDAISSSLSVMHALAQFGKNADVVIPEHAKDFDFLPGADQILNSGKEEQYDLAISVDCTDLKRLAGGKEYFETAKKTVEIDHHSVNAMFADYNYVDPVSPSCCQVLIAMFEYYGVEITKEIAVEGKIDKIVNLVQTYLQNLSNRDYINFDEKYIKLIFYCIAMNLKVYRAKSEMEV